MILYVDVFDIFVPKLKTDWPIENSDYFKAILFNSSHILRPYAKGVALTEKEGSYVFSIIWPIC